MMWKCEICGCEFKTNRGLRIHYTRKHPEYNYKAKIVLKTCKKCGAILSKHSQSGYCNLHRPRTGKDNPFYGKHHTRETIEKIRNDNREYSKQLWQNPKYREKVIKGISKPRSDLFAKQQSQRIKQWYLDHPEQKDLRSRKMQQSWIEGKLFKNGSSCRSKKEKLSV